MTSQLKELGIVIDSIKQKAILINQDMLRCINSVNTGFGVVERLKKQFPTIPISVIKETITDTALRLCDPAPKIVMEIDKFTARIINGTTDEDEESLMANIWFGDYYADKTAITALKEFEKK